MAKIWVREFVGGLDARRLPETTPGGVLTTAEDCHINRGGEIEQRAAFVPEYSLPPGTVGLAADRNGLYVFGHTTAPSGIPAGINYQQLQHTDGVTALTRILSYTLFGGQLYVVAEFEDGAVLHFFNGERVEAWFDGRASATFSVVGGVPGAEATGSLEVLDTGVSTDQSVTAVTVGGDDILDGPVAVTVGATAEDVATAIAASITASTAGYTASADGAVVTISAGETEASNGLAVSAIDTDGTLDVCGNFVAISGGVTAPKLTGLRVGGVQIIGGEVAWTTNSGAAADIVTAINTFTSDPEYTAEASGNSVTIFASDTGDEANGLAVEFETEGTFTFNPTETTMQGGDESTTGSFQPGPFVETVKSKVYAISGPNLHFSGIKEPTGWSTDSTGAGFIDMSTEASGSEELTAISRYQNNIAVFAGRVVQIWFVDPDPALNRQVQVLENTGTIAPLSVTTFGDSDVFYLDRSGVRSLKARDSSNAAFSSDIGNPIDNLLLEAFRTLSDEEESRAIGLIEPRDGRFWLSLKDKIYVFSFFTGSKISAWSIYNPGFDVEYMLPFRRYVYVRNGDTVYVYGGLSETPEYDATAVRARLPFLDGNDPAREKQFTGVDAAVRGEWQVRAYFSPTNPEASELVGRVDETTFETQRIPLQARSTHASVEFISEGGSADGGPAVLGSVVLHYDAIGGEDA